MWHETPDEVLALVSELSSSNASIRYWLPRGPFGGRTPVKDLTGETISHYRIVELVGHGGMGAVYKAVDIRLDRVVALKFLPPDLTRDPEAKSRFIHEAKATSALQHDNICTIHDVDESPDGQLFICMDFYDGESLKEKIDRGPLPAGEAIAIAIQVAHGLAKAHGAGVVHRDIKPANIMVTGEGEAKIVDFGLAKLAGQTKLTRVGSTIGTVAYMSPEQARGDEVDLRSDIWSLGVVLYEMVTGQLPFRSEYEHAVIYSILNDDVRPISGIDARLDGIIRKALRKEPSARYQRMEELESELGGLIEEYRAVGANTRRMPASIWQRKRRAFLSGIAVFGSLIAVIGYFVIRPAGQQPASPIKRLVVLPFANLGPVEEEYFTDGMTEELTSRLSSLSNLRVISRTSAAQYVKTNKTMEQVGRELDVDYALEGVVRWAPSQQGKNRVRINVNLSRISERTTLWAETYDRVIDDIFALQSDISQKVVEHLGITLLEPERKTVEVTPTRNLEAYQAFLRARYFRSRPHFTAANWMKAIEAYQQAVALDTGFALAYAELAWMHARLYYLWQDHSENRLQMAAVAGGRATALDPESPAVHLALGYYYLYAYRDPRKANVEFAVAEQGMPNRVDVLEAKAAALSLEGRWNESAEYTRAASQLSPRDGSLLVNLAEMYWVLRRYEEAFNTCNKAIELTPDDAWPYLIKVFVVWSWKGAPSEARATLAAVPTSHEWASWTWFWQEVFERRYSQAIERLTSTPDPWIRTKCWAMPKTLLAALAYKLSGEREKSHEAYISAKDMLEVEVRRWPDDPRYHSSLGIAYASLGRKDEAIQEGERAVGLLPVSRDAFYGLPFMEDLAFTFAQVGETGKALHQLDTLLSMPSWISVPWLSMDPQWDALRGQPGFVKLLEKYSKGEG